MGSEMCIRDRYLCLVLFGILAFASCASAQQSVYVPDYSSADISGWNTTTGGTILVPYNLTSGAVVGGIGSSFDLPYQVTLSGVSGSGYDIPVSTSGNTLINHLSVRPNDVTATPTNGSQLNAIFSLGAAPVPGPGFSLAGSNVFQFSGGFTGSTSNVIAQLQSPFAQLDHGQTASYVWDIEVGGLGDTLINNSPRNDSRGLFFDSGIQSDGPELRTFIAFSPVPEPASAVLSLFGTALVLGRRRRVIA